MRKIAILIAVLIAGTVSVFAQNQIKGKITDANNGSPIPGITVKVKGADKAVTTASDGTFTLNTANTSETLEITGVSYLTQTVLAQAGQPLDVVLSPESQNLSEVIVTALGITRSKNTLPYAATTIKGSDVNQTRNSNLVANLSGKVAGLNIQQTNSMGGSTNVLLRGFKSLSGNNQALFVIDGVPFDNSNNNTTDQTTGRGGYDYGNAAADINPDDVESISVLKGAAASALYGSRGFNGVILINTKKGKKGFTVTVNSGVTHNSILGNTFPTYQKNYGQGYGFYYGPNEDANFNEADINGDGVPDLLSPLTEDASYGGRFDPSLLVYQWSSFDPTSPNFGKALPWVAGAKDPSSFFEKPLSFNNSVFVEAGSDKGTYALGYTRNNEKGVLPNSELDKNLLNFSATYKLNDKITVGASANYSDITGKGRYGTGYDGANALNLMTNFRQWWSVATDMDELKSAYFRNRQNITWNPASRNNITTPIFWDNPYFTRYESYESDNRKRLFGNVSLNYNVFSWLNILGRISTDTYDEIQEERKAVTSVGVPFYRRFNRRYNEINYDVIGTANFDLNSDLNLKALGGTNIRVQKTSSIDAITNGGLGLPRLYVLSNSINTPLPPVELEGTRRVEGLFAGATFTYKNTYILDGTIRRDRSSTLPDGNNVYYYPSVSAGFVFSELVKPSWMNYGKIRVNYAEVGGDAPLYSTKDTYVHDIDPNSGSEVSTYNGNSLFSVSNTKNNLALRPERTKSFEVGAEMTFLQSRVGFDVTYYNAKTVDQIIPVTVSSATGFSRRFVNSGIIQNSGIEVSLNFSPIKTTDFTWAINANWTRNRNKVLELFGGVDNIILGDFQGSLTTNASLDQPYGTIHGTDFIYDEVSGQRVVGANGRYLKTPTNNVTIGNINPDWTGGVTNRFSYKGLTASFLIDVKKGGDVFSTDLYYGLATGLYPETAGANDLGNPLRAPIADGGGIIREGVTEDGKPNTLRVSASNYGAYGYRYAPDKSFVYDAGFVKLREASLGYAFPGTMFTRGVIKGIELSLVGRNLWIIHKNLPYADPEEGFSSGNLQGIQTGAYPTTRSIGFNVKVRL
ncbi:MAG: SusC/RagA family TonB-linked outer membrane protein [Bacteroidota bacterium]